MDNMELIYTGITWEEVCKTLDDLPEHEQVEFLADIIIDCLFE